LATNVGIWQLRDMDPLKTWVKGRTILIGDAAHPSAPCFDLSDLELTACAVLPHRAGGAASAIEDAEALGVFLRGVGRAGVSAALQRVYRVRAARAADFQAKSRADGLRGGDKLAGGRGGDVFAMWMYPGAERWEAEHPELSAEA
jgi:salicylate hydroxylase